jgi:type III secretion system (T3SS) SseB-like protein
MNPTTSTNPEPAMSRGGTFIRPGAVGWGPWDGPQPDADRTSPAVIEHALASAIKDPDRVTDLLDELSRGRLWLPLPEDRPVTDGSDVLLPTVTYLGAEFVPAFTSARRLASWLGRTGVGGQAASPMPTSPMPTSPVPAQNQGDGDSPRMSSGDGPFATMPHIVVAAADLARRMPTGVGIALNPGAEASVPIYPEAVGYLAATLVVTDGTQVRVGRPPADPVTLLNEVRTVLGSVPDVLQASRAWLSVPGRGEGLVISVTLHDPAAESARTEVLATIERAVHAVPEQGFPIDVTFPGEGEPDQVDEWISAHAEPFYIRSRDAAS